MTGAIVADRLPLNEFHHEVRPPVRCRAAIEQPRNIGMFKTGENAALGVETIQDETTVHPAPDDFDGDLLCELLVVAHRRVNRAHSAGTDQGRDAIRAKPLSNQIAFRWDRQGFGRTLDRFLNEGLEDFVGQQRFDLAL